MKELLLDLASRIIDELLKLGVKEAEFYGSWGHEIYADISNGRVKRAGVRILGHYGIRGAINKKVASLGSTDLKSDPKEIALTLYKLVKASPEDKDWPGFATNYSRGIMGSRFDDKLLDLTPEDTVKIVRELLDTSVNAAIESGADESQVTEGYMGISTGGIIIANSYGEHLYDDLSSVTIWYSVKSRKNIEEASYDLFYVSRRLDLDKMLGEARRTGEYSVKFIGAKPIEGGTYKVLLDPYIAAGFVSTALAPAFSALNVQRNRSPLKGRIDEEVLSRNIDIIDDPSIDWAIGTRCFDDEGIPTTRKYLINKGVLETFLYDYYTASKEGKISTGNGFRRSPSSPPTPSHTNLVIEGRSTTSFEELVKDIDKGLIVHGVIGYWMSNFVNGSTQGTITHGLYVENGDVKYPVKGVVMGGNIYDWLGKDLLGIGKEVEIRGDIKAPPILINNVSIAGK